MSAHLAADIAVCVPVRDEQATLPALLAALARQRGVSGRFVACFLFDGCQDDGQTLVHDAAAKAPFAIFTRMIARSAQPNAGRARRAAMALGLEAIRGGHQQLLLSTDADTVPADDWILASIASLREIDVVAGYILRRHARRMAVRFRLETYRERLCRLQRTIDPISYDPAPAHFSEGGASLGLRASVYQALGGFAAKASDEDVGLVTAARHAGYRVRHDRTVRVATSSRRRGRARGGLADDLRNGSRSKALPKVVDPDEAARQYARYAAARHAFAEAARPEALAVLAKTLEMPVELIAEMACVAPSAEAFTMRVVPNLANPPAMDLAQAEERLARLETEFGCAS